MTEWGDQVNFFTSPLPYGINVQTHTFIGYKQQ